MLKIHEMMDAQIERSNQGAVKATQGFTEFEMAGYRFRFGPSVIDGPRPYDPKRQTFTLWRWNAHYWQIEIADCATGDIEAAKYSMQFKLAFEKQDRARKPTPPQGVQVFHEAGGSYLLIEDGKAVAARMTQAHAERFKVAINSHAELVEVLKKAVTWMATWASLDSEMHAEGPMRHDLKRAQAALAKAHTPLTCPRCAKPTAAFGLCAECGKEERGNP